jgi:hypothetical protein
MLLLMTKTGNNIFLMFPIYSESTAAPWLEKTPILPKICKNIIEVCILRKNTYVVIYLRNFQYIEYITSFALMDDDATYLGTYIGTWVWKCM